MNGAGVRVERLAVGTPDLDRPIGTAYVRLGPPAAYKSLREMTLAELTDACVNFDLRRGGELERLEAVGIEIRRRHEDAIAALDDATWFMVVTRTRDPLGDDWWTRAVRHESVRAG